MPLQPSTSLRIVAADNELDLRRYYERVIPVLGHQVVGVAADGAELVALCEKHDPDLVITDNGMPEMCGLDAMRQVGSRFAVISADDKPSNIECEFPHQLLAYLTKPFKLLDLAELLELAWWAHTHRVWSPGSVVD